MKIHGNVYSKLTRFPSSIFKYMYLYLLSRMGYFSSSGTMYTISASKLIFGVIQVVHLFVLKQNISRTQLLKMHMILTSAEEKWNGLRGKS